MYGGVQRNRKKKKVIIKKNSKRDVRDKRAETVDYNGNSRQKSSKDWRSGSSTKLRKKKKQG